MSQELRNLFSLATSLKEEALFEHHKRKIKQYKQILELTKINPTEIEFCSLLIIPPMFRIQSKMKQINWVNLQTQLNSNEKQ